MRASSSSRPIDAGDGANKKRSPSAHVEETNSRTQFSATPRDASFGQNCDWKFEFFVGDENFWGKLV